IYYFPCLTSWGNLEFQHNKYLFPADFAQRLDQHRLNWLSSIDYSRDSAIMSEGSSEKVVIVQMIAVEDQPLSFGENPGLINLIEE
uniref:Uncharacterized protein n=1 Tax=Romanomermis culicivorax TaxID=13658 RepID=A0A915HE81_ROMCU